MSHQFGIFMSLPPEVNKEFIAEQYTQYWEMLRWHISSSWNIPALSLLIISGLLGFSLDKIDKVKENYLILSVICLFTSMFLAVMLIHHNRNLLWVRYYEDALKNLENKYGDPQGVYHSQVNSNIRGFVKISSSKLLELFLGLCSLTFFAMSLYLTYLHITG